MSPWTKQARGGKTKKSFTAHIRKLAWFQTRDNVFCRLSCNLDYMAQGIKVAEVAEILETHSKSFDGLHAQMGKSRNLKYFQII